MPCAAARLTRMPEKEPGPKPTRMRLNFSRGMPSRTSAGKSEAEWRCGPANSIDCTTTCALPSAMLPIEVDVSRARSSIGSGGSGGFQLPDHALRQADHLQLPVLGLGWKKGSDAFRPFDERDAIAGQI